jgi:hypothetical protein
MRSAAAIVLSIWVCVAAPALCTGVVIIHPCACDDCCGCEHESTCGDDPCSIVATRNESSSQLQPQLVLVRPLPDHAADVWSPALRVADAPFTLLLMGMPYPPSDVPLLI